MAGENDRRWWLGVWLAIEAHSKDEAEAVLGRALARLDREMPLRGEPVLRRRSRDPGEDIWVAELEPDMTVFQPIENDNAWTRCSLIQTYIPDWGVTWSVPVRSERKTRFEWPTEIWSIRPGDNDVLLDPAVRAIKIFCEEVTQEGRGQDAIQEGGRQDAHS